MSPWITRLSAWSAAGFGVERLVEALCAGAPLARPVPYDQPGLRSPLAALTGAADATELLDAVVAEVLPAEGDCGLVVATTSGDISGAFEAWDRGGRLTPERLWRQDPTEAVGARRGLAPRTTLSVACASGAAAFVIAAGWLAEGRCARVIVAGVDRLGPYIHAGFAGLGALAAGPSRAFQADRDGLMLGEGAAALLLETPAAAAAAGRTALTALRGAGLSQDAVHMTAPDREGRGLARAAARALAAAGLAPEQIDAVSAHGTGTPFNDAMEARALAGLWGEAPVPLHAAKPVIGHTLGAAGALEAVALVAMLAGAPCPAPPAPIGDDCPILVRRPGLARAGLSVNAAFGGINAAIVLGPPTATLPSPRLPVRAAASSSLEADTIPLAEIPGAPPALGRADTYVRAGLAALCRLGPLPPEAAVVLTSQSNCRAADLRYHETLLRLGPAGASRVHFIYTIPGAPLAEASILLGLRGPGLALCDGPEAGHALARDLVARSEAPVCVALHVEAPERHAHATATRYEAA